MGRAAWRGAGARGGGPRFAQYSAIIQAARSGLGIGLVPRILVEDELAGGDLYSPCGASVVVDQGHYLCVRPDRLDLPAFGVFREWLLEQGALSREATGSSARA